MSIPPGFVEPHHQAAVDVKEEVVRRSSEGQSLAGIAGQSLSVAGGRYAEKTLWRWLQAWEKRRERQEQRLWASLLRQGLDEPLPRERKSAWRALFAAWPMADSGESLFAALLRLDRSPMLSPS